MDIYCILYTINSISNVQYDKLLIFICGMRCIKAHHILCMYCMYVSKRTTLYYTVYCTVCTDCTVLYCTVFFFFLSMYCTVLFFFLSMLLYCTTSFFLQTKNIRGENSGFSKKKKKKKKIIFSMFTPVTLQKFPISMFRVR